MTLLFKERLFISEKLNRNISKIAYLENGHQILFVLIAQELRDDNDSTTKQNKLIQQKKKKIALLA